jgi:hypothetical protein
MESEDRLLPQSLVIPDPSFTVIVRAPQTRRVIGASVEHSGMGGIGGDRQGEDIGRQTLAEWLPAGQVGNPLTWFRASLSYSSLLATDQKA